MTEAEIATEALMGVRRVEWCEWGIVFCRGQRVVATLMYPRGAGRWAGGVSGSPERERYRAGCRAWVATGVLPDGITKGLA